MKRNRFADMVPQTPEDFHDSVIDALNRLEAAPARRPSRRRYDGLLKAAASLVVIAALGAMMMYLLGNRPANDDVVVNPDAALNTSAPVEHDSRRENACGIDFELTNVRLEDNVAGFVENGIVAFDWQLTVPEDETLLFSTDFAITENDTVAKLDVFGAYTLPGSGINDLALAGADVFDCGNGAQVARTEQVPFLEPVTGPVTLMLRVNVFKPLAEFMEWGGTGVEAFERIPKWIVQRESGGLYYAEAIDYYGRYEYKTPYGTELLDTYTFYDNGGEYLYAERTTEAELERYNGFMSDMRRALLQLYGFAEPLTEFVVRVEFDPATGAYSVDIDEQV